MPRHANFSAITAKTNLFFLPPPTHSHQKKLDLKGFHTSRKNNPQVAPVSCQTELTTKKGQELGFFPIPWRMMGDIGIKINIKRLTHISVENSRFLPFVVWVFSNVSFPFNLNQLSSLCSCSLLWFFNHIIIKFKDKWIKPSYFMLEKSNNQSLEICTWIILKNQYQFFLWIALFTFHDLRHSKWNGILFKKFPTSPSKCVFLCL